MYQAASLVKEGSTIVAGAWARLCEGENLQMCDLSVVNDKNTIIMPFLFYLNHGTHEEQPGNGPGYPEHDTSDKELSGPADELWAVREECR